MVAEKAKSIAVAVDGSTAAWEAMQRAINMARLLQLPLDVLHVIQLRKAGYFAFIDRHLQEDQQAVPAASHRRRRIVVPHAGPANLDHLNARLQVDAGPEDQQAGRDRIKQGAVYEMRGREREGRIQSEDDVARDDHQRRQGGRTF